MEKRLRAGRYVLSIKQEHRDAGARIAHHATEEEAQ